MTKQQAKKEHFMKTTLAFILISLVSSFSFADHFTPRLEPLLGVMTSPHGVRIQVNSGGCTNKRSIAVQKEKVGSVIKIAFFRIEEDPCLAFFYYGDILNYSFEELGLHEHDIFMVRNPLTFSRVNFLY